MSHDGGKRIRERSGIRRLLPDTCAHGGGVQEALEVLLRLLAELGSTVSEARRCSQHKRSRFLGMLLKTNEGGAGRMSVTTSQKMKKAETTAAELMHQKVITVKQAQRNAVGYFIHRCQDIYTAKCFTKRLLREITDAEKQGKRNTTRQ